VESNKQKKVKTMDQIFPEFSDRNNKMRIDSTIRKIFEKSNPLDFLNSDIRNYLQNQKVKSDLFQEAIDKNKKHTYLISSSITMDSAYLKDIKGLIHYDSRSLWEVLHTLHPKANVVYLSSVSIKKNIVDHVLSFFPNPEELRKRIKIIGLDDRRTDISLIEKVLSNQEVIKKVKKLIVPNATILRPFMTSVYEHELAEILDVHVFGFHPDLTFYQTKSGNRQVFKESSVPHPGGICNIKSEDALISALELLWNNHQEVRRFMVKLDTGVSGNGNAIFNMPMKYEHFILSGIKTRKQIILKALENMEFNAPSMTWESFKEQLKNGSIVETFIEGEIKDAPSAQALITASGEVEVISTHEQLLCSKGASYQGSLFPAKSSYRKRLHKYTYEIGSILASKGLRGPFSVDYLTTSNIEGQKELWAIEINLRQGGTTHSFQTAKILSDSTYDEKSGNLIDKKNNKIIYRSNDNFSDVRLKGKLVDKLLKYMKKEKLIFNKKKQEGISFHLLGAMSEFGKIGFTAISTNQKDLNKLLQKFESRIEIFLCQK
jgi:hypothetical protein